MKYRFLKTNEKIKENDQWLVGRRWMVVLELAIGVPLYSCNYKKFRRPITRNKSNAAQRAIKRGNKKTRRA